MVWSRCARGTVEVQSRYGRSTVEVLSRCGHGTVVVRSWYGRGAVKVLSRYLVRSRFARGKARSRFVHACYSRLDAPRTWYMHYIIYCSQYGRGAVRYSLGTLQVRSWYGTLKVHSRLVFSRALNLVHVLYVLVFASRNRGLAGFRSPGSDRDNKLSLC